MSVPDAIDTHVLGEETALRQRIIDAALVIALRGQEIPTPANIAAQTGLSERQNTKIYPGLDELAADIRRVAAVRYAALETAMPTASTLEVMLEELVSLRAEYYETVGELRQLGDAGEGFLPSLVKARAVREGRYRGRLTNAFSAHFGQSTPVVIPKMELLTSWETWRHLRSVQCLSKEQASALVLGMLRDVTATA